MAYGQIQTGRPPLDQPFYGAPFGAAIARFVKKSFVYRGRASRSEFWWVVLVLAVLYALGLTLTAVLGAGARSADLADQLGPLTVGLLMVLVQLAVLPSLIALMVRRLHDVNMAGWFAFLAFAPIFGYVTLLVFAALPSVPQGARFDGPMHAQMQAQMQAPHGAPYGAPAQQQYQQPYQQPYRG